MVDAVPSTGIEPELLCAKPEHIERLIVEPTDSCNLRCVYCHQNTPGFEARREMPQSTLDAIADYARRHRIPEIDFVGAGDLMMMTEWRERCELLLSLGVRLNTTVNLGKLLSDEEVETLARFSVLTVSIDTLDRDLLRRIRKNVDIRTILYNMTRVKLAAERGGHKQLRWSISAVLYQENALKLPELAEFAVSFGTWAFGVQDLIEYGDIKDNVTSVWKLRGMEGRPIGMGAWKALQIATDAGLVEITQGDLRERINTLAGGHWNPPAPQDKLSAGQEIDLLRRTYVEGLPRGVTRDCHDPWTFLQVLGDGYVRPCCFSGLTLGRLGDGGGLDALRNGPRAMKLREGLLTGNLDEFCAACNLRKEISVAAYQKKMRAGFLSASIGEDATPSAAATSVVEKETTQQPESKPPAASTKHARGILKLMSHTAYRLAKVAWGKLVAAPVQPSDKSNH